MWSKRRTFGSQYQYFPSKRIPVEILNPILRDSIPDSPYRYDDKYKTYSSNVMYAASVLKSCDYLLSKYDSLKWFNGAWFKRYITLDTTPEMNTLAFRVFLNSSNRCVTMRAMLKKCVRNVMYILFSFEDGQNNYYTIYGKIESVRINLVFDSSCFFSVEDEISDVKKMYFIDEFNGDAKKIYEKIFMENDFLTNCKIAIVTLEKYCEIFFDMRPTDYLKSLNFDFKNRGRFENFSILFSLAKRFLIGDLSEKVFHLNNYFSSGVFGSEVHPTTKKRICLSIYNRKQIFKTNVFLTFRDFSEDTFNPSKFCHPEIIDDVKTIFRKKFTFLFNSMRAGNQKIKITNDPINETSIFCSRILYTNCFFIYDDGNDCKIIYTMEYPTKLSMIFAESLRCKFLNIEYNLIENIYSLDDQDFFEQSEWYGICHRYNTILYEKFSDYLLNTINLDRASLESAIVFKLSREYDDN